MTQPEPTYTITVHWHSIDEIEPTTETTPHWATARTRALRHTTLAGVVAVTVRDPDGELIANWDAYSNLWREPRPQPKFIGTLVDVARARQLANDYRDKPTPARAHNAAQALDAVLDQLDGARKLNANLWGFIAKLALKRPNERITAIADLGNTYRTAGPEAAIAELATQLDMPPLAALPVEWCAAPGPTLGAVTLQCFLARGHEGDHSTNAHPNPRTWPPLATGGIVNPNAPIHRIGD